MPELARPAPLVRPARPKTPTVGTPARPPGKVAAKPALGTSEQPAKPKGPLSIMISLDRQQLTLYAGGEPIAHSRVSTGQKGHSTPTGVFSIIQKDRWHRSNLYDDAPMYFMQRITWSGVALHQGIVPNYPASHGCIRLPEAFAKQLWGTTQVGVRVIITHGEVAPQEIAHPRLFAPKAPATAALTPVDSLAAAQQAWKIAQLGGAVPCRFASTCSIRRPLVPRPAARPIIRPDLGVHQPQGKASCSCKGALSRCYAPVGSTARKPRHHVFTANGARAMRYAGPWCRPSSGRRRQACRRLQARCSTASSSRRPRSTAFPRLTTAGASWASPTRASAETARHQLHRAHALTS
jgi:hypothetical protein